MSYSQLNDHHRFLVVTNVQGMGGVSARVVLARLREAENEMIEAGCFHVDSGYSFADWLAELSDRTHDKVYTGNRQWLGTETKGPCSWAIT